MKRHETLVPFSREHHETLILAQLLKKGAPVYKGLPAHKEGKIIYAQALFNEKMRAHFDAEEVMMGKLKSLNNEKLNEMGEDIKNDHRIITVMFEKLSPASMEDELDLLGKKVEEHIRKEERILFPFIEQVTPAEILAEMNSALRH